MTLDPNKPTDKIAVSELHALIRENRVAINAMAGAGNGGVTNLIVALGTTSLIVGTDVGVYGYEAVIIAAAGLVNLSKILGGSEGQVKVLVFQDNNISIVDGVASAGNIYLNQLPALSSFGAQDGDVLALVNIGGDGASVYGYWKELYRSIAVK